MADFTKQINTAYKLISKNGRLITITQETKGDYDTATGSVGAGTSSSYSFYGITLPATLGRIESFEVRFVEDSSLINREVRFLMLAAKDAGFAPKPTDTVSLDGNTYSIIGVTRVSINGQDIVYRMGVWR